jgi:hypothetical protein
MARRRGGLKVGMPRYSLQNYFSKEGLLYFSAFKITFFFLLEVLMFSSEVGRLYSGLETF